ncbi:MAG: esterase family protein, partial [Clostridia bacterium]|nr:esterase family protein [Clostridia bacterium]
MSLLHIDYYSEILGRNARMDVILPEGDLVQKAPWKLLLLLHGMTDDHTIWQRRTTLEEFVRYKNMCVVMPTTYLGFYTNTYRGERYFDHIADEVIAIVRRMFPLVTKERSETFVAGLSMGGYGAVKCALTRPEVFSKAASFSGALDIASASKLEENDPMVNFWADIFGPQEGVSGGKNDLFALASKLRENKPELFIWCGTEDFLYSMNTAFRDHLESIDYPHIYTETPGFHDWLFWEREIRNAINWMLKEAE